MSISDRMTSKPKDVNMKIAGYGNENIVTQTDYPIDLRCSKYEQQLGSLKNGFPQRSIVCDRL